MFPRSPNSLLRHGNVLSPGRVAYSNLTHTRRSVEMSKNEGTKRTLTDIGHNCSEPWHDPSLIIRTRDVDGSGKDRGYFLAAFNSGLQYHGTHTPIKNLAHVEIQLPIGHGNDIPCQKQMHRAWRSCVSPHAVMLIFKQAESTISI